MVGGSPDERAVVLLASFTVDMYNRGQWSSPSERNGIISGEVASELGKAGGDAAAAALSLARYAAGEPPYEDPLGLVREGFEVPSSAELVEQARMGYIRMAKHGGRYHSYAGGDPFAGAGLAGTVIGFIGGYGPAR